jgi:hypothetical protein
MQSGEPTAAVRNSQAPAEPKVVPPHPSAAPTFSLELRANPLEAQLFLDNAPLQNPFVGSYPLDGLVHSVRAEARGYLSESRKLRPGRDCVVELSLVPLHPAPLPLAPVQPTAAQGPRPAIRASTASPDLPRLKPDRRPLDPTNPWAR